MIYIDTSIFMYAAGKEHPYKSPSLKVLELIAMGELEGVISVEVIQEILHRYIHIGAKEKGICLAKKVLEIIPKIYNVEYSDILKSLEILEKYDIMARDAIHIAVMLNRKMR